MDWDDLLLSIILTLVRLAMGALENRPEIKCSHIKGKIKALELIEPAVRDRVLARFPKSTFDIVQSAKDDEWVPVEFMVEFVKCVVAEIGEQELYNWNIMAFNYSIEMSTWGTSLRTGMNLFGIKTTTMINLGPYIWKRMYRNCGELSIVRKSQNQEQIFIKDLPPLILGYRAYLSAIGAGFLCLCTLGNIEARIEFEQPENTKDVVYLITWNLKKKEI